MSEKRYRFSMFIKFYNGEKNYTYGSDDASLQKGDQVVVETLKGLELGYIANEPSEETLGEEFEIKPIIRKATKQDTDNWERNESDARTAMVKCKEAIDKLGLGMNLTSAEYTLDKGRLTFTYVADERVDFRELLHVLASTFHTRIELRQIGPRDKAKIVGGIGLCGMPLCCARFQKDFDVISINMAKNQLLALNPQKLSGQCGKLMCCLAYENDAYKDLRQGLPKMNAPITYKGTNYRVTSMNVLENTAKLTNPDSYVDLTLDELRKIYHPVKNTDENNEEAEADHAKTKELSK